MENISILIYGELHRNWKEVFAEDSKLWLNFPQIKKVILSKNKDFKIDHSFDKQIIIPVMEQNIIDCPKGFYSLIAPLKSIETLKNKKRFMEFLKDNNLSDYCPIQYTRQDVVYPAILKPVHKSGGIDMLVVNDKKHLDQYIDSREFVHNDGRLKEYVLEEYISDEKEYVSHLMCKDGKIISHASVQYINKSSQYIRHGVEGYIERYDLSENHLNVFSHIIELLNFSGPCNVGFKIQNGKTKIFEINPRYGASMVTHKILREDFIESIRVILQNATLKEE